LRTVEEAVGPNNEFTVGQVGELGDLSA